VKIKGFVGTLESVKKTSSAQQFFFVNGRYMRHPYFHRAVLQAYENMIPVGNTPDYFIYFTIDPATIDVNIHPTKTEIKFENERAVWQILHSVVRETLAKSNSIPVIEFENPDVERIDIPVYNPDRAPEKPQIELNGDYNPFNVRTDDWKKLYQSFTAEGGAAAASVPIEAPADATPSVGDAIAAPSSCFQYKNRYIITPLKSGLVIIDQHRAHVRILYERYLRNVRRRTSVIQKLLFPEIIELSAAESSLFAPMKDDLLYLGFDIEYLGGMSYAINGAPADITGHNPAALVREVFAAAAEEGLTGIEKATEKAALSLAKAAAIPNGKALSTAEMEEIVASLFSIEANGLTPDGLPTLTVITDEELEKRL